MKRLLALLTIFVCLPAHADQFFFRQHDADSQIVGPICAYAEADAKEVQAIDFDTTGLGITFTTSASTTSFNYPVADIINVTTPGTWEDPPAGDIGLDQVTTGEHNGCFLLHLRDEILAVSNALDWVIMISDDGVLITDTPARIIAAETKQDIRVEMDDNSTKLASILVDTGTTLHDFLVLLVQRTNYIEFTSVASAASETTIVLDSAASGQDDAYVGYIVSFVDQFDNSLRSAGYVTAYVGSTRTITNSVNLPDVPSAGDFVLLWPAHSNIAASETDSINAATLAANTIGASELATDAIGADEIATNAIGSLELAIDAINSGVIAADAIGASELAANAIGASELADDAIDAAAVATNAIDADAIALDAIGASELAADAVDKIRDGIGHAVFSGTADSGDQTSFVDAVLTEADANYWAKNVAVLFTSGSVSGQVFCVVRFEPSTDTVSFTPAATQAVATNTYTLIAAPGCDPFR